MTFDLRVVVTMAVGATVLLWAAAVTLRRVDGRVTARGFRNGSIVAVILFLVTTIVVTIYFNGQYIYISTLDLTGAFALALIVGLIVGLGYLWLGGLLIAIGLIFNAKPAWST